MDIQTEYAVIRCIIDNETVLYDGLTSLKLSDFQSPLGKKVYETIVELSNSGVGADETLIKNKINSPEFNKNYNKFIKTVNIDIGLYKDYFNALKNEALKDSTKRVLTKGLQSLSRDGGDATTVLKETESSLINLLIRKTNMAFTPVGEDIDDFFEELYSDEPVKRPIVSGHTELDDKLFIENGNLILIGGRPSMGKSSLAINMMCYNAIVRNVTTSMFSVEMTKRDQLKRIIQHIAQVGGYKFKKKGRFNETDYHSMDLARNFLKNNTNILINDLSSIDIQEVSAVARKEKMRNPDLAAIFVDYAGQLITSGNTLQEMTLISKGLKNLARDLDIPVIALAQLSRQCENREDKRPRLSDLRESGALEQDADAVVFCYSPGEYTKSLQDKDKSELIIAKQRNGTKGTVETTFIKDLVSFGNIHKAYPTILNKK